MDNVLVQGLQQKLATQVPVPHALGGQDFVNSHPDLFSERKVFIVDQIACLGRPIRRSSGASNPSRRWNRSSPC